MKSTNRTLAVQIREIEEVLTQRLDAKSQETDVKYVDVLVKENRELKEQVDHVQAIFVVNGNM